MVKVRVRVWVRVRVKVRIRVRVSVNLFATHPVAATGCVNTRTYWSGRSDRTMFQLTIKCQYAKKVLP